MSVEMNRRQFLKIGAGAFAALGAGCSFLRRTDSSYSVLVLGDVHFDAPEIGVYHAHYKPKPGSVGAKIFPLRMKREHNQWSGLMQGLAAAARRDVRHDTRFVLQLGDLIQGNCAKAASFRDRLLLQAFCLARCYYRHRGCRRWGRTANQARQWS